MNLYIIIIFLLKINQQSEVRIENMHYVVYMQNVQLSQHFPPKAINLAYFTENNENVKVSLTSNYVLIFRFRYGQYIKTKYC